MQAGFEVAALAHDWISCVPQISPSPFYQKHPPLQPDGTVHVHATAAAARSVLRRRRN